MCSNAEVVLALRDLANRIEKCERELRCSVEASIFGNETLEKLKQSCAIVQDISLDSESSGSTSWVSAKIGGDVAITFYYPSGLLGRKAVRQVEHEVDADVSLLK